MFWDFVKAKGKLRLCGLFALCAVLLGCAIFAFAGIFGGKNFFKNENNSQDGNSIIANAAPTINKNGNVWTVTASNTADMADAWRQALNASTESTAITFKLNSDWNASSGNFATTTIKTSDGSTAVATDGMHIPSNRNIILDLNGHKVNRGLTFATKKSGRIFTNNGTFTITDTSSAKNGQITGSASIDKGGAIYNTKTLTINAGQITGNKTTHWGGAIFNESGSVTITGGTFSNNIASAISDTEVSGESCGGFLMSEYTGNSVTITGGTFTGNKAAHGAVFDVRGNGRLKITAGTFNGNVTTGNGGVIHLFGAGEISGGSFTNNKAFNGGALYTRKDVTTAENYNFKITGGTFTGNSADYGGVLRNQGRASSEITGGTFQNNTAKDGGGIFNESTAELRLSGNPVISGNKATTGAADNIKLGGNTPIKIVGAMTNTTKIGIKLDAYPAAFTLNFGTHNSGKNPATYFSSDNSSYVVLSVAGVTTEGLIAASGTSTSGIVPLPTAQPNLYYSGGSQTIINGYVSTKMTASAITSGASTSGNSIVATNAGTYSVTFTPKSGFKWPDGTNTAKTVTATMSTRTPIISGWGSKTVTYTGSAQSIAAPKTTPSTGITWAVTYKNSSNAAVTNPTDAGTYTATATPTYNKNNYNTISNQTATLTINKSGLNVTAFSYGTAPVYYGASSAPTKTIQRASTNTTITSGYGAITYSIASGDQNSTTYPGAATINSSTGVVTGTKLGKIRITMSIAASTNYNAATKTVEVTVGKATLTDASSAYTGTYDKTAHGITVSVTGLKNSETLSGVGTIKYGTTAGTYNLTTAPTRTDAGEITVYYQITFTNYNTITGSKKITINKKAITGITDVNFNNKVYDGVTTTTLKGTNESNYGVTFAGLISGDLLSITSATTINFNNANAGSGKTVTATGIVLGGTSAGNYSIANTVTATGTADVTARSLSSGSTVTVDGTYTYTGAAQTPNFTVTNSGVVSPSGYELVSGTDYEVSYSNATNAGTTVANDITNAGTVTITVTGKGNFSGTATQTFVISKATISGVTWDVPGDGYEYDGTEKQPKVSGVTTTATAGLPSDVSEMFEYSGWATTKGSHTATAELKSAYAANYEITSAADKRTVTVAYTIGLAKITLDAITAAYVGVYDGKKHKILTGMKANTVGAADNNVRWWYSGSDILEGASGWIQFSSLSDLPEVQDVSDTKTYYFKVTADNHETLLFSRQARVNAKSLGSGSGAVADITYDAIPGYTYDGTAKQPTPTVYDNATNRITAPVKGGDGEWDYTHSDYKYSYNNNIAAGTKTAVLIITGQGNYTGSFQILYTIDAREIGLSTITVTGIADSVYNHGEQKEVPTLTDTVVGNATLELGTDFEVSYERDGGAAADFTNVGTITVVITGKGNYKGSKTVSYEITAYDLSGAGAVTIGSVVNQTYTGAGITPEPGITVNFDGSEVTLVKGTDFEYTYTDNVNAGTATITVTGKGNYKLSASGTFVIEAKEISGVSGITADNKVYDGTTGYDNAVITNGGAAANVHYDNAVLAGNADGGNLVVSAASGEFDGVNTGTHSVTVTVTGLGGSAAGNYKLPDGGLSVVVSGVDIVAREIEIDWEYKNVQYDGTSKKPNATVKNKVDGDAIELVTNLVGADSAVVPGQYTVEVTGVLHDDAGNYVLPSNSADKTTTFNITTENTATRIKESSLTQTYDGAVKLPGLEYLDEDGVTWKPVENDGKNYTLSFVGLDGSSLSEVDGKQVPVNAGKYKVTITISPAYSWSDVQPGKSRDFTLEILRATVTGITLTGAEQVYSGSEYSLEADWSGVMIDGVHTGEQPEGVTVTYLYNGAATSGVVNAGAHTVTARFSVNGNYNVIADITATLKIAKAEYNLDSPEYGVAFADGSASYTGEKHKLEITGRLPAGVSVVYEYVKDGVNYGADGVTAVGEYTVTARFSFDNALDGDNYKITKDGLEVSALTAKLIIGKQQAEVDGIEFADATVTYDGNVHKLQVSGTQEGIIGVRYEYRLNGALVGTDGVRNAGEYRVTAKFEVDGNYDPASAPDITKTLVIERAALTVTATDTTIIYGDNPATGKYSATYTGLVTGDSASVLGTPVIRVNSSVYAIYGNVGSYTKAIEISGLTGAGASNYDITYEYGTLTVRPKTITVNWYNDSSKSTQDLSYVYTSGVVHTPYADVTNAVNHDSVTVTVSGGAENAGMNYEATAVSVSNTNYTLPVNGLKVHFEVLPQPKNGVIIWDNSPLYYNGAEQTPKAYYYENETDNTPEELPVTTNKRAVNVGEYVATVNLGGNYTLTGETTKNYRIEKRRIYIEIGDLTAGMGAIDVSKTPWSYVSGSLEFVSGETYTLTFRTEPVTGAGKYAIECEFSSGNAGNYEVTFSGSYTQSGDSRDGKCGTLTVTEGAYDMSKVTYAGLEVTYDGSVHTLKATGLPVGISASYEYILNGWSLGTSGVTDAGEYTVTVRFSGEASGYAKIPDATLKMTVKKASLTIKANDHTIVYGDAPGDNGVTYGIAGVEGTLDGVLTLTTEYTRYGNAGKYRIVAGGLSAKNYEITYVPGTLTVTPREVRVTWYSDSSATISGTSFVYDYDGAEHKPYAVATGMVHGDSLILTVTGGQTASGLNYKAEITGLSNANYAIASGDESIEFSIIEKNVIIWDNSSMEYNGASQAPKAVYYDVAGAEHTLTVEVRNAGGGVISAINAGEYTAYVVGAPAGITGETSKTFAISPKRVTVSVGNASMTYGEISGNLATVLNNLLSNLDGKDGFIAADGIPVTLSCVVTDASNVGEYVITGANSGNANYVITVISGKLTIEKASVDVSGIIFDGVTDSVTYDGKTHGIAVNALPAGVTKVTYKYYLDGVEVAESEVIGVGVYTITAEFTVDGNHNPVTGTYSATLTITAANLTNKVTFAGATVTYDGSEHSLYVSGDMTGITGVRYEYMLNGTQVSTSGAVTAGTYDVMVHFSVEANYNPIPAKTARLEIRKAQLTVTAENGSIEYGETPSAAGYGYTVAGLALADAADSVLGTLTYTYGAITGVGTVSITISGAAATDNYTITYKTGTLTVTPYTLRAEDVQWYDKAGGTLLGGGKFEYTYIPGTMQQPYAEARALINGETVTLIVSGGKINAGYGYEAEIVGISGVSASNYALPVTGIKVVFDILPSPLAGKIVWSLEPIYYDGSEQKPRAYYYDADGNEYEFTNVETDRASVNAGKYTASVSIDDINYTLTGETSKTFEILARKVCVEIGDMEVRYGETPNMSAVTWRVTSGSFLAGESYRITFSAGAVSGLGEYKISGTFSSANASNYEVIFTGSWASAGADNGRYGTLKVVRAVYDMSKVTYAGTETTYNGGLQKITINGLPAGVTANCEYVRSGFGYGANGVRDAGEYTVTIRFLGDANYEAIADVTLKMTVKKASLTIKANDATTEYGEAAENAGVTYSGFAAGENEDTANVLRGGLTYAYDYMKGNNAGEYSITPSGLSSENYEITYKAGTLRVLPRTITVTWYDDETQSAQTYIYPNDGEYHAPYAVAGGAVNGDRIALGVTGAKNAQGINYVATATLDDNNYRLPDDGSATQKFTIMPKSGSIVWDNTPMYYNGANQVPKAYYFDDAGTAHEITGVSVYNASEAINAGDYTATVVFDGEARYCPFTILPLEVKIEINDAASATEYGKAVVVDQSGWRYAAGSAEFVTGSPIVLETVAVAGSKVGKYAITGRCTDANYKVTFVNGALEICKATIDVSGVSYGELSVSYDGNEHRLDVSNLPAGVTGVICTYEKDGVSYGTGGVRDAGEYTVTVRFIVTDTSNYNLAGDVTVTFEISRESADVSGVTFADVTAVYDGDAQEIRVTGTATGVTGVTYTYYESDGVTTVAGNVAKNAGEYKVKAEFTFDANYDGSGVTPLWATLKIEKAQLTVTADDGAVTYGDAANVSGYSVSGLAGSDSESAVIGTVTVSVATYTQTTAAGKYAGEITISGNATHANYDITYTAGTLTVMPREISVTGWQKSETDASALLEYDYVAGATYIPYAVAGNTVNGDAVVLKVEVAKEPAGNDYVATVTGVYKADGTLDGNYKLPATDLKTTFSIKYTTPVAYEIIWNYNETYYDGTSHKPGAEYWDDAISGYVTVNPSWIEVYDAAGKAVTAINAGKYVAKVTDTTVSFTNAADGVEFEILPRKVYITIGDGESEYGARHDLSGVTWSYASADAAHKFLAGDSYNVTLKTDATTSSAAGKYAIYGELSGNANYEAVFTGGSWASAGADNGACGTLTIVKAKYDMSGVSVTGVTAVYDGATHEITLTGLPTGVQATITYTRDGWSYNGGKDAGEYTVRITFSGDAVNYEPIADMHLTLEIVKAKLTVTANASVIEYGDAPQSAGVTYAGFVGGDSESAAGVLGGALSYEFGYVQGGNVGNYTITPKGLTAANYEITYAAGNLKVEKREITVNWFNDSRMNSQTLRYPCDGNTYLPYAEAGNVLDGDSVVLTVTGAQSAAGINYEAEITGISNENYKLPATGGKCSFDIIPDSYVIVWESAPFVYDGTTKKPRAYYFTVNGEQVELNVSVKPNYGASDGSGSSVYAGEYLAVASLRGGNVTLSGEFEHKFEISKRKVTVVIGDATTAYGEEITLGGWTYAEGSDEFAVGAPIYLQSPVTKASPVGTYPITGVYAGTENSYDVTFIDGTYTVEKAAVEIPEILGKEYNGLLQKADVTDTAVYRVYQNDGGIAAGKYKVILEIRDYDNYKWQYNGVDIRSANYTVMFEITQAANALTTEFVAREIKAGKAMNVVLPVSRFGTAEIAYYKDSACTEAANVTGNVWNDVEGTYYAKVTVAGTDDYEGLEKVYAFTVTGKLELSLYWGDLEHEYDGNVWAPKAYVTLDGREIELNVTGGQSNAGTYNASVTLSAKDGTDLSKYAFASGAGAAATTVQFTVTPKEITVIIVDMESGYGTATLDVNLYNADRCEIEGTLVGTDNRNSLNLTFGCDFGEDAYAAAGKYAIVGNCGNGNYKVTFKGTMGDAGTYTVTEAAIKVLNNGTTWFDEQGVIGEYQDYFVTLGDVDEDGEYKNLTLMGGQTAKITYSTYIAKYDAAVHDNMSEASIMMMFADGGQSAAPKIEQGGSWVVYYKIEADSHTTKYGIWKVLIEDPDNYVIITFVKPYKVQYGDVTGKNILPELIAQGCIELSGKVIPNLTALQAYAEAYAYENIDDAVDGGTQVSSYTIRLVFNKDGMDRYGEYSFKYSASNKPGSDTNLDKFEVVKRVVNVTWTNTEFTANGNKLMPEITLGGFVGGQSVTIKEYVIGEAQEIVLDNGDIVNVTVLHTDGDKDMTNESYTLKVVIDNPNYTLDGESKLITINPQPPKGVALPTWAIIAIAAGGALLILILIIVIVVAKKRKNKLQIAEDIDGFSDDYTGG